MDNNNWYEWIFSGIGTSIISGIVGSIIGGIAGYKFGIHKSKIKQIQNAKDDSKQSQTGTKCNSDTVKNTIKQTQNAGNKADQIQIGEN